VPTNSLDTRSWAEKEFGNCNLGDQRRTSRRIRLAEQVMSCPSGTLPDQTETWADVKAAYRLFDVEEVTFKSVTQAHLQQTRTCPDDAYLILEDTTELDFGSHRKIEALGPTGRGTGWGFLLHSGLRENRCR
jgi:hypothetical protein